MITEDYVDFEMAELLKQKGFDVPTWFYYQNKELKLASWSGWDEDWNHCLINDKPSTLISAPTFQEVERWFREIHHIDICVCRELDEYGKCFNGYIAVIYQDGCYKVTIRDATKDLTYEEATNKAIKYGLTLI